MDWDFFFGPEGPRLEIYVVACDGFRGIQRNANPEIKSGIVFQLLFFT